MPWSTEETITLFKSQVPYPGSSNQVRNVYFLQVRNPSFLEWKSKFSWLCSMFFFPCTPTIFRNPGSTVGTYKELVYKKHSSVKIHFWQPGTIQLYLTFPCCQANLFIVGLLYFSSIHINLCNSTSPLVKSLVSYNTFCSQNSLSCCV